MDLFYVAVIAVEAIVIALLVRKLQAASAPTPAPSAAPAAVARKKPSAHHKAKAK